MALIDQLGAVDPEGVMSDLIAERAPDLVGTNPVDPQSVMNRLIRKGLDQNQQRKLQQTPEAAPPADLSGFGKTKEEVDAQPQEDFSAFGQEAPATPAPPPKPKDEWGGYGSVIARAGAKGAVENTGHVLKGVGAVMQPPDEPVDMGPNGGGPKVDETDLAPRKTTQPQLPTPKNPITRAGEATLEFGEKNIPLSPTEADSITGRTARAVGGFLPLAAGMAVGGAVGNVPGAIAVGAGMMAASSGSAAYDEAIAKGADDVTAAKAAKLNAIVGGALGALPLGVILAPFRATAPGLVGIAATALEKALRAGVVFTTVGEAQQYIGEQIAKELYDPNAGYSPDAKRIVSSFLAGGIIGAATPPYRAGGPGAAPAGAPPTAGALPGPGGPAAPGGGGAPGAGPSAGPGAGPRPSAGPPPPPFESALRPKLRRTLEAKAAYYKEFEAADIASWSDDKLKDYVNTKFGGGSARSAEEPQPQQPEPPPQSYNAENKRSAEKPGPAQAQRTKEDLAPDEPSAEPHSDLKAQLGDLHDADNPRAAVWLPKTSVEHLGRFGLTPDVLKGSQVIQDFDGKGGVLIARDQEVAQQAVADRDAGVPLQTVVGKLTGAGDGKPADATHVVQQYDADGNVTRERGVRRSDIQATLKEFEAPGRSARVMAPEEAIIRRDHLVAKEAAAGTRSQPVTVETGADVARAAQVAATDYSPEQGEANNRKLGHIKWNGGSGTHLHGSVEVASGGTRRGTNPETGEPWETTHSVPYGYIKGTEGADGMHVDAYWGPEPNGDHPVYVLDEKDEKSGKFRQHKALIGFDSPDAAMEAYLGTSTKKPHHIGGLRALTVDEFKSWVKEGDTKTALSDAMGKGATADQAMADLATMFNEAGAADHAAIETALTEAGIDPKHVRPADITRAAEIHANEGAPPDQAVVVAVVRNLVDDGHMSRADLEKELGHDAAKDILEAGDGAERGVRAETERPATAGPAAEAAQEVDHSGAETGGAIPASAEQRTGDEAHGGERPGQQEGGAAAASGAAHGRSAVGQAAGGGRNAEADERGPGEAGRPARQAADRHERKGGGAAEAAVERQPPKGYEISRSPTSGGYSVTDPDGHRVPGPFATRNEAVGAAHADAESFEADQHSELREDLHNALADAKIPLETVLPEVEARAIIIMAAHGQHPLDALEAALMQVEREHNDVPEQLLFDFGIAKDALDAINELTPPADREGAAPARGEVAEGPGESPEQEREPAHGAGEGAGDEPVTDAGEVRAWWDDDLQPDERSRILKQLDPETLLTSAKWDDLGAERQRDLTKVHGDETRDLPGKGTLINRIKWMLEPESEWREFQWRKLAEKSGLDTALDTLAKAVDIPSATYPQASVAGSMARVVADIAKNHGRSASVAVKTKGKKAEPERAAARAAFDPIIAKAEKLSDAANHRMATLLDEAIKKKGIESDTPLKITGGFFDGRTGAHMQEIYGHANVRPAATSLQIITAPRGDWLHVGPDEIRDRVSIIDEAEMERFNSTPQWEMTYGGEEGEGPEYLADLLNEVAAGELKLEVGDYNEGTVISIDGAGVAIGRNLGDLKPDEIIRNFLETAQKEAGFDAGDIVHIEQAIEERSKADETKATTVREEAAKNKTAMIEGMKAVAAKKPIADEVRALLEKDTVFNNDGKPLITGKGDKTKLSAQGKRWFDANSRREAEEAAHAKIMAELPDDIPGMINAYRNAIRDYNEAIIGGDKKGTAAASERMDLLQEKANGEDGRFGVATFESPAEQLRAATSAPMGEIPKWGQRGAFILEVDGIRYLVTEGVQMSQSIHAVDGDKPFPSETGYRSSPGSGVTQSGLTVKEYWEEAIRSYVKSEYPKGKASMPTPDVWYRLPKDWNEVNEENPRPGQPIMTGGEYGKSSRLKNEEYATQRAAKIDKAREKAFAALKKRKPAEKVLDDQTDKNGAMLAVGDVVRGKTVGGGDTEGVVRELLKDGNGVEAAHIHHFDDMNSIHELKKLEKVEPPGAAPAKAKSSEAGAPASKPGPSPLEAVDIDSAIDNALDATFGKKPVVAAKTLPPAIGKPRTTPEAPTRVMPEPTADEALSKIADIFNGPEPDDELGAAMALPPKGTAPATTSSDFDDGTYARVSPLFKSAAAKFGSDPKDVAKLAQQMVAELHQKHGLTRDGLERMRPYLRRFIEDVRGGKIELGTVAAAPAPDHIEGKETGHEHGQPGSQNSPPLDNVPAAEGGGVESGASPGRGNPGDGEARPSGDGAPADAGLPGARGGGSGAAPVRLSDARTGRGSAGLGAERTGAKRARVPSERARVTTAEAPSLPGINFRITPDVELGHGTEGQKFADNLAAIRIVKAIAREQRRATPEEQRALARYVGWGGLANAFADRTTGVFKDGWEKKGQELADLLTADELRAARASTRNAHYTSETVARAMWDGAKRLGFKGGLTLELSAGTGNFLGLIPDDIAGSTKFIAVEQDAITSNIAKLLYPQATVLHAGLQEVPLSNGEAVLNIGNPPFGSESLRFQYKPELHKLSIHNQFFLAGIDAVRPGGLQIAVVSRYLLDAQDSQARRMLAMKAELLGAIRLPDTAFVENARTEVVTDIVFLQRHSAAKEQAMVEADATLRDHGKVDADKKRRAEAMFPDWIDVTQVKDPLGGDPITVNSYFAKNAKMILGRLERSGTMRHGQDVTVAVDKGTDLSPLLAKAIERLPSDVLDIGDDVVQASLARHQAMGEALEIAVSGEEPGHVANRDGTLTLTYERETPTGGYELARRSVTAASPWSRQLYVDHEGKWYSLEAAVDAKGEKVKAAKGSKRNVYERKYYDNDLPGSMRLGEAKFDRLKQAVELRDLVKRQLVLESQDAPSTDMEDNRAKLAKAYKGYVAEHGLLNDPKNASLVTDMPDGALVLALELGYRPAISEAKAARTGEKAHPPTATPAPIMSRRVVPKYEPATKADSLQDALSISLSERGRVDMERIAGLLGASQEETAEKLQAGDKPLAFFDPEMGSWETANAYLSGQVTRKLKAAKAASLDRNIKALEAVQPAPWSADQINAQVGSTWVPQNIYADFASHLAGGKAEVRFAPVTNSFALRFAEDTDSAKVRLWQTDDMSFAAILGGMLNSRVPKVIRERADGSSYVDQEASALVALKAKEIENEFADWVFKDRDRRNQLVSVFNEKFNTRVTRQHDGSHLQLPGKVPDEIIKLRRHQKNAVWRGIHERFMLLDHVVGAGKTFTAIARAMERKRMGLSRKPMVAVPNHLVEQWASDVYRLYPGAKVLAAGRNQFDRQNRRRLFAKIATGDWDIIIVPHSSFAFIGIAKETELRFLDEELRIALQAVEEAQEQAELDGIAGGRRKPFNVKEAERLVTTIETRMDRLKNASRDRLLTFEQMGVDDLTVDEAHEFKNLFYSSRLTGVRGMGDKSGSQKAFDLYNKVRVLRESPNGTVTFMTGTPISNSAVEMFTMMRYLAAAELKELGLEHFDAWRAQSVSATSKFEPTEAGGLKEVTRLGRSWSNMRALMELYYSFTDSVPQEDITKAYAEDNNGAPFPVPRVVGGKRQEVVVKPTPAQTFILESVIEGFNGLSGISDPYERNAARLRLMDRARKVSLDARAVDPHNTSKEEGGKLDAIADNVARIHKATEADKGTQLVFLDRSVRAAKQDSAIIKAYDELVAKRDEARAKGDEEGYRSAIDALDRYDANEIAELRRAQQGGWNAYDQLKQNLIKRGIPADEVRFVQEANTDAEKKAIFDAVNDGSIRVLIGSTPRMGAGTNVQERIVALHHGDVTWKPSDIEQREGRGIRQGNKLLDKYGHDNFALEIMAYVTERTVDAKMWDLNSTKLRMINGIRKYDGSFTMEFEDEDAVGMAEIAALASGDPLMLERVKLAAEIDKLELMERAHRRKTNGLEDAIERHERALKEFPGQIEAVKAAAADIAGPIKAVAERAAARTATVEGQTHKTGLEAAAAAEAAIGKQKAGDENGKYSIEVNGARLTNQAAIEEALQNSFGDSRPFEAKVGGETMVRRSQFARAVQAKVEPLLKTLSTVKEGNTGSVVVGSMLNADVAVSAKKNWMGISVEIALIKDGRTLAADTQYTEKEAYSLQAARALFDSLEKDIDNVRTSTGEWMKVRMASAEAELPGLRHDLLKPFAQGEQLNEKRGRLEAVISELAARTKAAEGGGTPQPTNNDAELFASMGLPAKPDWYYSGVGRAIEAAKQERAAPNQWLGWLRNQPGVKPEEIQWLGLEEWLRDHKGPVSKAEIADYVRANSIQVKEVEKGGAVSDDTIARAKAWLEENEKNFGYDADDIYDITEGLREGTQGAIEDMEGLGAPDAILNPIYHAVNGGATQFSKWVLPGGAAYRELLLTLPEKDTITERKVKVPNGWGDTDGGNIGVERTGNTGADYRSSHWKEPNVLAHVRFNERTIDGKPALLLEEVQSDWHQQGRRLGYQKPLAEKEQQAAIEKLQGLEARIGSMHSRRDTAEYASLEVEVGLLRQKIAGTRGVPNAPFKTTWPELVMKRMIRYAAERGYDKIAWPVGEVHAARYDLSAQIRELRVLKEDDGAGGHQYTLDAVDQTGKVVSLGGPFRNDTLADAIGKDMADKIVATPIRLNGQKIYSGLDLKVGGEGMLGFYDDILPAAVNKLVKKYGARVGKGNVDTGNADDHRFALVDATDQGEGEVLQTFATHVEADKAMNSPEWDEITGVEVRPIPAKNVAVHTLDITPALHDAAMGQGFPLFMGRPTPATAFQPSKGLTDFAEQRRLQELAKRKPRPEAPELQPQPSGFTREFELRQTEIARHLTDLIHHIAGPRIAVRYRDQISLSKSPPGWGGGSKPITIGGAYLPLVDMIRLALHDPKFPDKLTSAFHESWHAVEDHFVSDQELALLKREEPRLREIAARAYGMKADEISHIADFEIRAIAFQAYAKDRATGGNGAGLHIGIRALFERLLRLFRQIANYLRGLGFNTAEDIFGKAYQGEMKDRLSRKLDEGMPSRIAETLLAEKARAAAIAADEFGAAMAMPPLRALTTELSVAKAFKNFWTSTFQPELFSDRALMADPLFARYKSASSQEKDSLIRQSESEWAYWNKRNDAERLAFIDMLERGIAPADPVQAGMARRYRRMLDANHALERMFGSKAAFVDDYFPHIWERPDDWRAFAEARSAQMGPTWFQKKRTYETIMEGLAAGLKLKYTNPVDIVVHRLSSGVDMRQRMDLLHKLKDMGLAWEGDHGGAPLIRRGWRAINAPDRKQWVVAPDAQLLWKNGLDAKGFWQAEHIGGGIFRGWMALKNAWVPVKLALSAFHPLHVLHINYSNGMGLGWDELTKGRDLGAAIKAVVGGFTGPLTAAPGASTGAVVGALLGSTVVPVGPYWGAVGGSITGAVAMGMAKRRGVPDFPHQGKAARAAWAKRPSQQTPEEKAVVALMTDGGFVPQLAEQLKISAKRQLAEAFQKILRHEAGVSDWRKFVSSAMRRPIEKLQAPIFETWIPSLKAAAYLKAAAALLKRRPDLLTNDTDRRVALRAISKSIDNRFGEMFYGTLFWNRYLKDAGIASFLSLGWNLGFVREFGGATMEAVTRPAGLFTPFEPNAPRRTARDANNKLAFAIAYMASSALILGMMSMLNDDDHKFPEGLDWVFPRIGGKNPDGSPRRVTNMSYIREVPMLLKHVQERGGNYLTGAAEMLWNKLMFEPFKELMENRDYYGYNIWDEHAPLYKQIWQGFSHTFFDQTSPMSIAGAKYAAQLSGKPFPSFKEALENPGKFTDALTAKGVGMSVLGFGPAPAYVEKSPTQNRISHLYREHVAPASRPYEDGENTRDKMAVRTAILIAKRDKDSKGLQEAYAKGRTLGIKPETMQKYGTTPTDTYLFSRLPAADQRAVLDMASPEERRKYFPKAHQAVKTEFNRRVIPSRDAVAP